jgi:cold shock CspA family protein
MQGRVQKYVELRGYGFILLDFKTRVFFHLRDWKSDLAPQVGMHVTFDLSPSSNPAKYKLNQAINVAAVEHVGGGAR